MVFGSNSGFAPSLDLSNLDGINGFTINGINGTDFSGRSVSSAGDVNGDGIDDVIIGAYAADPNGLSSGESYVVFGSASPAVSLELSSLNGTNGFTLKGIDVGDQSGFSVSSAGDVNGDSFDDVIIGAFSSNSGEGESYVVFGSNSGFAPSLELSSLNGTNGFTINGIDTGDNSGISVSSAGDVNGDNIDDLIIGGRFADPNGNSSGETYVVFGSNSGFTASFNLSSLNGTNGFTIDGIDAGDNSGRAVSSAGDINGDTFDDLIIGAPQADLNGDSNVGESYVVFGSNSGFASSLELSSLDGTNGFTLKGIDEFDFSGSSLSNAGDVNGDGFDDLIIGAAFADPNGKNGAGESYVVFGNIPEIEVLGNATSISDGDATPTTADHTNFGSQDIASGTVERTFTIENTGTGDLTLGANAVTVSGMDAADFTITSQPTTTVAPGGSTTFVISFDPSTLGVKNATLSINNDDSDENPYNFDIQGTGIDAIAPTFTSIVRKAPATNPTNFDTLIFRATFDEDVQNVDTGDFDVNGSTTAAVTNVSTVNASVYDITVSGGDLAGFDGTVGLDLTGGQDIADLSSNALGAGEPATDETYTLDNTAPIVTVDSLTTFDTTPALTGTVNDTSASIEVTVDGNNYAATNNGDGTWSLADNTISPALGGGTYEIAVTATDTAGNIGNDSSSDEVTIAIAGVTITQTNSSTDVGEGGAADTYMVVLDAQPTGDVIVNITPNAQTVVNSPSLTFTDSNWDTAQTVTVTANDDSTIEGDHSGTITHAIAPGSAAEYLGLSINSVAVNITDNDCNEITSGPGAETLTGTSLPDCFIYSGLLDGGDTIANFTNGDKIDLSGVLGQIGYSGSNPIADSYLLFQAVGSHAIVQLDIDGSATRGVPRGFLLVENITPAALNDLNNFII